MLFLYTIGCVISMILGCALIKKEKEEVSLGIFICIIFVSMLSWIAVISFIGAAIVIWLLTSDFFDKKLF